jgi:hypothetical protein
MRKIIVAAFLMAALLFVLPAAAQETTADLQGYVKDPSGAAIPKATAEITSSALIGSKKKQTDEAGYFRFHYLPPGEYTLSVSAPNFRTYKQTAIVLETGKLPTIDVTLQIGQMSGCGSLRQSTYRGCDDEQGRSDHSRGRIEESPPRRIVPVFDFVCPGRAAGTFAERHASRSGPRQRLPD